MDTQSSAIGQDAIAEIFRRLQPDAPWVLDLPDGFAWWGWEHRQDIRVAPALQGINDDHARIVIKTDAGVTVTPGDPRIPVWLAARNEFAFGGAARIVDSRVVIEASFLVSDDSLSWVTHTAAVAATSALVQRVADVADHLDEIDGTASPLMHPDAPARTRPDEILGLPLKLDEMARRAFPGAHPWDMDPWSEVEEFVSRNTPASAVSSSDQLFIKLPIETASRGGETTVLLCREQHPALGRGVLAVLDVQAGSRRASEAAVALNAAEIDRGGDEAFAGPMHFGGWTLAEEDAALVRYLLFVPDALAGMVSLANVALHMMKRGRNAKTWLLAAPPDAGRSRAHAPATTSKHAHSAVFTPEAKPRRSALEAIPELAAALASAGITGVVDPHTGNAHLAKGGVPLATLRAESPFVVWDAPAFGKFVQTAMDYNTRAQLLQSNRDASTFMLRASLRAQLELDVLLSAAKSAGCRVRTAGGLTRKEYFVWHPAFDEFVRFTVLRGQSHVVDVAFSSPAEFVPLRTLAGLADAAQAGQGMSRAAM